MFTPMAAVENTNLQLEPAVLLIAQDDRFYITLEDPNLPIAVPLNPKLSILMFLQNTVLGHLILKLVLQAAHLI